jgi:hypothetical protein
VEILRSDVADRFFPGGNVRVIQGKSRGKSRFVNYQTLALLRVVLLRLHFADKTMNVANSVLIGTEYTVSLVDILNRWWSGGKLQKPNSAALHSFDLCLSSAQCIAIVGSITGLKARLGACTWQYVKE